MANQKPFNPTVELSENLKLIRRLRESISKQIEEAQAQSQNVTNPKDKMDIAKQMADVLKIVVDSVKTLSMVEDQNGEKTSTTTPSLKDIFGDDSGD